jgi:hypothetical protein
MRTCGWKVPTPCNNSMHLRTRGGLVLILPATSPLHSPSPVGTSRTPRGDRFVIESGAALAPEESDEAELDFSADDRELVQMWRGQPFTLRYRSRAVGQGQVEAAFWIGLLARNAWTRWGL